MGFLVATLIKARLVRKAFNQAYACPQCKAFGSVSVYANRIEVSRCDC